MARREKFTIEQMREALEQTRGNQGRAAQLLGVHPPAVSKRMRKLNFGVAHNVSLYYAGEMVRETIDFSQQIVRLNEYANEILYKIMEVVRASEKKQKEKIQRLRPLMGDGNLLDFSLKYKMEIRKQMQLLVDVKEKVLIIQKLAKSQTIILEAIGRAAPELREDITRELVRADALLSSFG